MQRYYCYIQSINIYKHQAGQNMNYYYILAYFYHPFYQQLEIMPFNPTFQTPIISSQYLEVEQTLAKRPVQSQEMNNGPEELAKVRNPGKRRCSVSKEGEKERDRDYNPTYQREGKQRKYTQIQNRNILPNLIRSILTFLNQKRKSVALVKKLLSQNITSRQNYNSYRFYLYQRIIKNKLGNYVNENDLQIFERDHEEVIEIFSVEQQRLYNKISRILMMYFLNEEININILTSTKLTSEKKKMNLSAAKDLKYKLPYLLAHVTPKNQANEPV